LFVSLINYCSSSSLFHCSFVVCKDGSCGGGSGGACFDATIPYVVGPSCTGGSSCQSAKIGSADSSCNNFGSCNSAQLSGVDLINSCNNLQLVCFNTIYDEVTELIDCCNDDNSQCKDKVGANIVAAGCVSYCLLYCF